MRPASGEDGWFSLARGELCGGCHTCWGGGGEDEKTRIERMSISLPYVETSNSKVIKGFVPEQRSRYVFFEFRDSYVLCYICNEIPLYISYIHVYGYGTFGPAWTWERCQWRAALHSPKPSYYWNLAFRLFSVISRRRGGVLHLCRDAVGDFTAPAGWTILIVVKITATKRIYRNVTERPLKRGPRGLSRNLCMALDLAVKFKP